MITKYRFGTPFQTDAVVNPVPESAGTPAEFAVSIEDGRLTLRRTMAKAEVLYGLGENVRGINKRGWKYVSNATDDPNHVETRNTMYASHNFLIIDGETPFALFLDDPAVVTFDLGFEDRNQMVITAENADADLYLFTGADKEALAKEFRQLVGRSYIPPKWAFGFGQSRWSYMTADEVREVVKNFRDNGIPLDCLYLDIDYMERYKDFTINDTAFPDFAAFAAELKEQGIHLVPIIDAGVKIEDGYDVYEEGVEKNYFCKNADGSDFVGAVWPGLVHFPDVLQPEARRWFGLKYKRLMDQGIEGFWNDMNEPAIFYTNEKLKKLFADLAPYEQMDNIGVADFDDMRAIMGRLDTADDLYDQFYHNVNGKMLCHQQVHNLFGYNMTRAAGEAFQELEPNKRILMFSRSSYIGMHRYGGIWTGDNFAWWSHLLLNIQMMPSLNLCGILYCGADIGGFGKETTEDLVMRWTQFGLFTPLMRNHCAMGFRNQEPYRFTDTPAFARIIGIRYALLPYIYSEFVKAAVNNENYFRTLSFAYPDDPTAPQIEDQLMVGESIMVAPIYRQNAEGRYVYLPEDMKLLRMRSSEDYDVELLAAGHHYVPCALDEVLIFLRPGHLLPVCQTADSTMHLDEDTLHVFSYGDGSYELYQDDGYTTDYEKPKHFKTITVKDEAVTCSDPSIAVAAVE